MDLSLDHLQLGLIGSVIFEAWDVSDIDIGVIMPSSNITPNIKANGCRRKIPPGRSPPTPPAPPLWKTPAFLLVVCGLGLSVLINLVVLLLWAMHAK